MTRTLYIFSFCTQGLQNGCGKASCDVLFMGKAQDLFIEKYQVKKPEKFYLRREGDHMLLHISGERMLELKTYFCQDM